MNPFGGDATGYGAWGAVANLAATLGIGLVLASPTAAETRVLAFGDSLTAGYGVPEAEGFVPRLNVWLAENGVADVVVVNAGVSGDTSAGGLARIDWALEDNIDAVILELGANDMLRGIDPAVTRANLEGILGAIGAKGLPAIVAGFPTPPNYPEDYRKAFKAMFRDLAKEHDAILYPSFFSGIGQDRDVNEIMTHFQSDGLHPNPKGVQAIVDHIGPVVVELVEEARRQP